MASRKLPGFVGGLALTKDYIYVAGGWTDLHVVEAKGLAKPVERERDEAFVIPPFRPRRSRRFRIYRCDGQVRGVDLMGDTAVVAAGKDGIHVVELRPRMKLLHRYDTEGFAMAVSVSGDRVYVAEERGGLSVWRRSGRGALKSEGRYKPRGRIIRDVVVPPPGKYAVLQLDLSILDIVDVSNPAEPRRVFRDKGHGFVYHIGDDLTKDRCVCVLWQLGGLRWYRLYGGTGPGFTGEKYEYRLGNGGTAPADGKRLVVFGNGFVIVGREEGRPPSQLRVHRVGSHRLRGVPRLYGNRLYVSHRATGDISIVDVSNVERPKLLEHFNIRGNPGKVLVHDGSVIIPNGYEGLWVDDGKRKQSRSRARP